MPVPRTHQLSCFWCNVRSMPPAASRVINDELSPVERGTVMKRNAKWRRHLSRVRAAVERRQAIEAGSLQVERCQPAATTEILRRGANGMSRVDKALSIHPSKIYDSFDNCCLPKAALYCIDRRKPLND